MSSGVLSTYVTVTKLPPDKPKFDNCDYVKYEALTRANAPPEVLGVYTRPPLCYLHRSHRYHENPEPTKAVALIYVPTQSGAMHWYVCKYHLDEWLDIADNQPQWEPSALVWIN